MPYMYATQGKMQAYVVSCYLITMTLTTVGYGDIGADNNAERIGSLSLISLYLKPYTLHPTFYPTP